MVFSTEALFVASLWSALVIDDEPGIRQSVRLCLEANGGRVTCVGTVAGGRDALSRATFDVVFLDIWLGQDSGLDFLPEILRLQPNAGVVAFTAFASFESAVEAMKRGAADYLPKPFTPEQVRLAAQRIVERHYLEQRIGELEDRVDEATDLLSFTTASRRYAAFLQTASRAAASDAVILLRGESGTGKTVLARWIRYNGGRPGGPLVTVHCPLLSSELMSSILFGHVKGAFTGAVRDTLGKVEQAEGGTLFLDEVADLSADAQARLLRFLNDQTYERVGDATERRADVRLIAATNRRLEDDVGAGRFRADLLYRLNVITLDVPSLRDRQEDILPMARQYLNHFARRQGRGQLRFSPACEEAIVAAAWPGNLRELRNAVERAVVLGPTQCIEVADMGMPGGRPMAITGPDLGDHVSLEAIEREHLARVVATSDSFEAAARVLGIDVTTLQRKRKKYGLA
jgi:NtrC-family two-component system response regulator AlgB